MGKIYDISKIACTPDELQKIVMNGKIETNVMNEGIVFEYGKIRLAMDYRLFKFLREKDNDPNAAVNYRYRWGIENFADIQQLERLTILKAHTKMASDIPSGVFELKEADKCTGIMPAIITPKYSAETHSELLKMPKEEQAKHMDDVFKEALILANKGVAYNRLFMKPTGTTSKPLCGVKVTNIKTVFDYLYGNGINLDASDEEIQDMLDNIGRLINYLCKKHKLNDKNDQPLQLYDENSHIDETSYENISKNYKRLIKKR